MAYYKFAAALAQNKPIDVYNYGAMQRDFTYVDDAVEALFRLIDLPPKDIKNSPPYRVLNLGNNKPVRLQAFIDTLAQLLNIEVQKNLLPMQLGDVRKIHAQVDALKELTGFTPSTQLEEGLKVFVEWFKEIGHKFV